MTGPIGRCQEKRKGVPMPTTSTPPAAMDGRVLPLLRRHGPWGARARLYGAPGAAGLAAAPRRSTALP